MLNKNNNNNLKQNSNLKKFFPIDIFSHLSLELLQHNKFKAVLH